jgi:RNA polymerase sigma-70 factor (ECF subfamily)
MAEDQPRPAAVSAATDLAARVQAGDAGAEDELVRQFRGGLVAVMRARTRDPHAARELAHDTLLAVIAALRQGKLRDPERLAGFVHGVAKNVLASHYRRHAGEPATVPLGDQDWPRPEPADQEERERREILGRAVAELGPLDRQVLELSLVQGLQPTEIARRLGLTPDAVRMRKMRAVRRATESVQERLRSPAAEPQDE